MITLSTYDIKPRFQRSLRPLLGFLRNLRVTPNAITIGSMFLCLAFGMMVILFHEKALLWYPVILLVRMAMNALDGLMATTYSLRSESGAILNELTDAVSDGALYLPFLLFTEVSPLLLAALVLLGLTSEITGLSALLIGRQRGFHGPFGKSDRALFFGVVALLLSFGAFHNTYLVIGLFLSALTIWNRSFGLRS